LYKTKADECAKTANQKLQTKNQKPKITYIYNPMHLRKLSLINFKNYSEAGIDFDRGVNAFVGGNGEGKTNLLDAIHYLSLCKSYFNPVDSQNIRHEQDFFVVQGSFDLDSVEENITCSLKRSQKKVFKRNQKEYERLSSHIGLLPAVMISPTDSNLILGGSEERRRFIDSIISQFDSNYLDELISYSNVLIQRNAYLKQSVLNRTFDVEIVQIWDIQLIRSGMVIHSVRKKFIEEILPVFNQYYAYISGGKETVEVRYESHLNENDFALSLEESRERDRILQYTSVGTHKDDLIFRICDHPVKRFASQGQQKSFLIALKLAQFDFVRKQKDLKPILLLDDIFDKLDDERVAKLMDLVSRDNFGQIFITDTHPVRLVAIFGEMDIPIRVIPVKNGSVNEKTDSDPFPIGFKITQHQS
jgi:DNA replication and repair protein RecF